MERAAIFCDLAKLEVEFRKLGVHIDYLGLREYLGEGRIVVETFVYFPINPYTPERKNKFAAFLQHNGFIVRGKIGTPRPGRRWTCNCNVEMAVDVLNYIRDGRIDIVVIGSGSGDIVPVCEEVRRRGVRCEVASTGECADEEVISAASSFIDLGAVIRQQLGQIIRNGSEDANPIAPEPEAAQPDSL